MHRYAHIRRFWTYIHALFSIPMSGANAQTSTNKLKYTNEHTIGDRHKHTNIQNFRAYRGFIMLIQTHAHTHTLSSAAYTPTYTNEGRKSYIGAF